MIPRIKGPGKLSPTRTPLQRIRLSLIAATCSESRPTLDRDTPSKKTIWGNVLVLYHKIDLTNCGCSVVGVPRRLSGELLVKEIFIVVSVKKQRYDELKHSGKTEHGEGFAGQKEFEGAIPPILFCRQSERSSRSFRLTSWPAAQSGHTRKETSCSWNLGELEICTAQVARSLRRGPFGESPGAPHGS